MAHPDGETDKTLISIQMAHPDGETNRPILSISTSHNNVIQTELDALSRKHYS